MKQYFALSTTKTAFKIQASFYTSFYSASTVQIVTPTSFIAILQNPFCTLSHKCFVQLQPDTN